MKRMFFVILFLTVWLIPSLAGCAKGGAESHTRPMHVADAGRINPDAGHVTLDAGMPVLPRDAGMMAGFDAGRPVSASDAGAMTLSRDAGHAAPDAYVAPGDSHLLRIALTPALRSECPAGWRIRLWLTDTPVESTRGLDLELHIPDLTYFGPWSSITLWCDERMPAWESWDAGDRTALASNVFSVLSLDGVDLRASTMLCEDPLVPGGGFRPILMWDAGRRGTCPP